MAGWPFGCRYYPERWYRPRDGEGEAGGRPGGLAPALAPGDGDLRHRSAPAVTGNARRRDSGSVRPQARSAHAAAHYGGRIIGRRTNRANNADRSAQGGAPAYYVDHSAAHAEAR